MNYYLHGDEYGFLVKWDRRESKWVTSTHIREAATVYVAHGDILGLNSWVSGFENRDPALLDKFNIVTTKTFIRTVVPKNMVKSDSQILVCLAREYNVRATALAVAYGLRANKNKQHARYLVFSSIKGSLAAFNILKDNGIAVERIAASPNEAILECDDINAPALIQLTLSTVSIKVLSPAELQAEVERVRTELTEKYSWRVSSSYNDDDGYSADSY